MNILFLTLSRIYDLNGRGIYADLMRKFVHEGHNVYIVVPFERRTQRETSLFESAGAHILGVKTLNIQKANVIEKGIGTLLLESQYMRAIQRYLKDIRFDLVLYSTPPITFNKVIRFIKRKYGASSYLLLKDIFPQNAVDLGMLSPHSLIYRLFRKKERALYALSDYIGCMSPANVKYVIEHNPEIDSRCIEVCPNCIELLSGREKFDPLAIRKRYEIAPDKILCIYGGNLGKPQGIDFLIETIKSNERRKNCFFLIVGGGTEYNRLEQWFQIKKPANARLLNSLPKREYDLLMRSADIGLIYLDHRFTIPNYPSRLLSYLENAIPIMMAVDKNTDIGRIAEQNNYGYWAESDDIMAFDCKLDALLEDSSLRKSMGLRGYEYLKANYTVDHAMRIIMSHFIMER